MRLFLTLIYKSGGKMRHFFLVMAMLLSQNLIAQTVFYVSTQVDWNNAFSASENQNVIIELQNDINLGSSEYTHTNSNTITINTNGYKVMVGGNFQWIGGNPVKTLTLNGQAIITETLNMANSILNVNGKLETKNIVINYGESTTINIRENSLVRVYEDIKAPDAPNINIATSGGLDVLGDAEFNRVKLNLAEGSTMAVAGDFTVEQGYSVINGDVVVGGNMNIFWNNNNNNTQEIVGNGSITVYQDYRCHNDNENNGEICMQQLANHFTSKKIYYGSGEYINPLPIVLSKFSAVNNPNSVTISWTTESETDNDYFTIYRSEDGKNYEAIGTISGAGNSEHTINYTFIDYYPISDIEYYKLKQTDFDGQSEISHAIAIKRNSNKTATDVKIYPNPYHNNGMEITFGTSATDIQVTIMTLSGIIVERTKISESAGTLYLNPQLVTGVYVINIVANETSYCGKIVVE